MLAEERAQRTVSTTAGRAIVEILEAEGVRAVFGMPGGHVLDIYEGLHDSTAIRHILVRHEHAAAAMAAGYAQLTGEPGVCVATAGPGATNLLTAVAEALRRMPADGDLRRARARRHDRPARREPGGRHRPRLRAGDEVGGPHRPRLDWSPRSSTRRSPRRAAAGRARCTSTCPATCSASTWSSPYRPAGAPSRPLARSRPEVRELVDLLLGAARPILSPAAARRSSGAPGAARAGRSSAGTPVLTSLSGRGDDPRRPPARRRRPGRAPHRLSKRLLEEADVVVGPRHALRGDGDQLAPGPRARAGCGLRPGRHRARRARAQRAGGGRASSATSGARPARC